MVSGVLLSTLIFPEVSPLLASMWHISLILSLQVCSSHGIWVLLDKWIQVCLSTSGTTTVLEPIYILFLLIFVAIWGTSTVTGHVFMWNQLSTFHQHTV